MLGAQALGCGRLLVCGRVTAGFYVVVFVFALIWVFHPHVEKVMGSTLTLN